MLHSCATTRAWHAAARRGVVHSTRTGSAELARFVLPPLLPQPNPHRSALKHLLGAWQPALLMHELLHKPKHLLPGLLLLAHHLRLIAPARQLRFQHGPDVRIETAARQVCAPLVQTSSEVDVAGHLTGTRHALVSGAEGDDRVSCGQHLLLTRYLDLALLKADLAERRVLQRAWAPAGQLGVQGAQSIVWQPPPGELMALEGQPVPQIQLGSAANRQLGGQAAMLSRPGHDSLEARTPPLLHSITRVFST